MLNWIAQKGLIIEDLFNDVDFENFPDSVFTDTIERSIRMVRALGLKRIINVFCQTGKNFSADYFRERLSAIAVHEFLILIIFPTLESWRKDAETATMELKESTNCINLSDSIENVEIKF